ncbi:uncharacterized protein LOC135122415 isoform X3 [Zophobas morio]|uniref:uncharacterized protein LOC135122415 isoform X3 n=1 Tax=Zophobas morio TaxID=2755281 RepID=UPI00308396B2
MRLHSKVKIYRKPIGKLQKGEKIGNNVFTKQTSGPTIIENAAEKENIGELPPPDVLDTAFVDLEALDESTLNISSDISQRKTFLENNYLNSIEETINKVESTCSSQYSELYKRNDTNDNGESLCGSAHFNCEDLSTPLINPDTYSNTVLVSKEKCDIANFNDKETTNLTNNYAQVANIVNNIKDGPCKVSICESYLQDEVDLLTLESSSGINNLFLKHEYHDSLWADAEVTTPVNTTLLNNCRERKRISLELPSVFHNVVKKRKSIGKLVKVSCLEISEDDYLQSSLFSEFQDHLTALELLIDECDQEEVTSLEEYFCRLTSIKKVGEGSYAEVFKGTVISSKDVFCIKVIPLSNDCRVAKTPAEMRVELVVTKTLHRLYSQAPNFVQLLRAVSSYQVCCGPYPALLCQAWEEWESNNGSENPNPIFFTEENVFVVLAMCYKGPDLEKYKFNNPLEALSLVLQVVCSLVVAERALNFEHRDLHWGNVLISKTQKETLQYFVNNEVLIVATHGIEATIIDFTLSRLETNGNIYYYALEDEGFFTGVNDIQYDVYRKMRSLNDNNWKDFNPATNVLWVHYLLYKIINEKKLSRKKSRNQRKNLRIFKRFLDEIVDYKSLYEVIFKSEFSRRMVTMNELIIENTSN